MTQSSKPPPAGEELTAGEQTLARLVELGAAQYSLAEAAEDLGVTEAELTEFLAQLPTARKAFHNSLADARLRLRGVQFKLAEKSPTMAIFLGKQYLGQAGRRELDASARVAETAHDAQFVRDALAALATDRGAPGDRASGEDGAGRTAAEDPL